MHELPDVSEAVAIGMEDEILGKVIRLVAVTSPTSQVTANDIIRHCSLKLEHFKVPRQVEIRHAPLPKTSTGKIATREL